MPQARTLKHLMKIRARNRDLLDRLNGTLGTALGLKKPTGEMPSQEAAVIVFVPRKINPKWLPDGQEIPKELEGPNNLTCPVDVVEARHAEPEQVAPTPRAEDRIAEQLRGWDEVISAGSQIAVSDAGRQFFGTLGAFAKDRISPHAIGCLTNQHVALRFNKKVYHPIVGATLLGTTDLTTEFVEDEKWYGGFIDEPRTFVRADCAFVKFKDAFLDKHKDDINPHLKGVGPLGTTTELSLDDDVNSIIGQSVTRAGRTTGVRKGTIEFFGYEYNDGDRTEYTDFVIRGDEDRPFSAPGDSGSLIVDKNHHPMGLLWGGWQSKLTTGEGLRDWSYAIDLKRILDYLGIDLITDPAEIP